MTIYVVVKYLGDMSPDVVYGGSSEDAANHFVESVTPDAEILGGLIGNSHNYAVLPVEFDETS